eukprot:Nk52_evm41s359 gene=Nk52_evmTU41s359
MKERNGKQLLHNLAQLQNLIKRDPSSYKDEFAQQLLHFESMMEIFKLKPNEESKEFSEIVMFLSHCGHCYTKELKMFPNELMSLLKEHHANMEPELRKSLCKALILLRNKGLLSETALLELFFKLFSCQDKQLRELLYSHIVSDIRNMNQKQKNVKVNKTLQNFMYQMLNDPCQMAAKKSLDVMIELYRKNVWRDAKTVNVIASACLSSTMKLCVTAISFFLSGKNDNEDESDDEEDGPSRADITKHAKGVTKKTKKRAKQMERALDNLTKKRKRREGKTTESTDFSPLHLLNDPQGLAEKLFQMLKKSNEKFEIRALMMKMIGRLIGTHELFVLNFYPFMQKYLQPHQKDVTQVLTAVAQASHDLVPPETLEPVLMTIANNFVTERCSNEVMTVGLNSIREICARCNHCMPESLLHDLVEYKKSKDKSVTIASRSLIQLFRAVNPELLPRKERGRPDEEDAEFDALQYGQSGNASTFVPGAELLAEENVNSDGEIVEPEEGEDGGEWDGWEVASDNDDDEGEWIDVSSDEEGEEGKTTKEEKKKRSKEELAKIKEAASKMSTNRILTPADFAKIEELKKKRDAALATGGVKRKRGGVKTEVSVETNVKRSDAIVAEDDITAIYKKRKADKAGRIASIEEGRAGREKYGSRKGKLDKNVGSTNLEKKKTKNFMMIMHGRKIKAKKGRSFRDKQIAERAAIEKRKRQN